MCVAPALFLPVASRIRAVMLAKERPPLRAAENFVELSSESAGTVYATTKYNRTVYERASLRRAAPAKPSRPVPSRTRLDGSGAGAAVREKVPTPNPPAAPPRISS
jgi:hypothetical protein